MNFSSPLCVWQGEKFVNSVLMLCFQQPVVCFLLCVDTSPKAQYDKKMVQYDKALAYSKGLKAQSVVLSVKTASVCRFLVHRQRAVSQSLE